MKKVGIFYGHLKYITAMWHTLRQFGNLVSIRYVFHGMVTMSATVHALLQVSGLKMAQSEQAMPTPGQSRSAWLQLLRAWKGVQQGCQMVVYFHTKNPSLGNFLRALELKRLVYSLAIWNISRLFGTFYGHWVIKCQFGIFSSVLVCCAKKNLATLSLSSQFSCFRTLLKIKSRTEFMATVPNRFCLKCSPLF
jgi:hypothetical protein